MCWFIWVTYTFFFAFVLFIILFVMSLYHIDNNNDNGYNELAQDRLGIIQEFFWHAQEIFNTNKKDGKFNGTFSFEKISDEVLRLPMPIPRDSKIWAGNIYVQKDGTINNNLANIKGKLVVWRKNLSFETNYCAFRNNIIRYYERWQQIYIFSTIGSLILFGLTYINLKICKKTEIDKFLLVVSLVIIFIIPLFITLRLPSYDFFIKKNEKQKFVNYVTQRTYLPELQKLLNDTTEVSLQIAPLFLSTKGCDKVFVSKMPFFPYNYVRINLDVFNYLFYAPDVNDLKQINPLLEYKNLGNGFWLGSYAEFNAIKNRSAIEATIFCVIIWIGFMVFVIALCKNRVLRVKGQMTDRLNIDFKFL